MAAVIAPELHHSNAPPMRPPHGTKRPADNALDGEQRLSKRFDLLHLDSANNPARLYIAVPSSCDPSPLARDDDDGHDSKPGHDSMHLDDTPHRVYIHDLAAELTDSDSDSDRPVFLSDIEKHLSRIPPHVLQRPPPPPPVPTEHNQMVLYTVPASLTVPAHQDSVRKAIVDARQRLREHPTPVAHPSTRDEPEDEPEDDEPEDDEPEDDAMDLD